MRALAGMAAIEVMRLYRRPLPWFVLGIATLMMAVFYMLLIVRYLNHETTLAESGVTQEIMLRYFGTGAMFALLLVPLLTMNVLSSERRDGGLRFLFTIPLSTLDIVGGKLASLLTLAGALWFVITLIPLTLLWGTPIDLGVYAANALGLALFIALHVTLGVLASALTRQPVLAGIVALAAGLTLWFADWANRLDPQANALGGLSTASRMRGFTIGLINTGDIVYFAAGALACAALTVWRVAGMRRFD